jgi:hypothetical protein
MRKSYGPFKSVDDLRAIKGIGPKRIEKMRKYITVGTVTPKKGEQRYRAIHRKTVITCTAEDQRVRIRRHLRSANPSSCRSVQIKGAVPRQKTQCQVKSSMPSQARPPRKAGRTVAH